MQASGYLHSQLITHMSLWYTLDRRLGKSHDQFGHTATILTLTPWRRVLLEKLTSSQLVKKFPTFYGTQRLITSMTSACHLTVIMQFFDRQIHVEFEALTSVTKECLPRHNVLEEPVLPVYSILHRRQLIFHLVSTIGHNFSSPLKDVQPKIKETCYFPVLVSSMQETKYTLQANVFYHALLLLMILNLVLRHAFKRNMLLLRNIPTILIWKQILLLSFCVFQLSCIKSFNTLQKSFLSLLCSNICSETDTFI